MRLSLKHLNWASIFLRGTKPLGIGGLAMAAMALGSPIVIYSTGYGQGPGEQDPNYTFTVNALGNGTATYVAEGSSPTGWPLNGTWATDSKAAWIAPKADVVNIAGTGSDTQYVYTTTFNLTGFDPATANLSGYWTADNYIAQVQLNGHTVYDYSSCMSPSPQSGFFFQNLDPFDISHGFQSGNNTLSFTVTNSNCFNTPPLTNPTGLFVDISGTVDPLPGIVVSPLDSLPEPGTLFCTAFGLVLFFYCATQRNRSRAHQTPPSQGTLGP